MIKTFHNQIFIQTLGFALVVMLAWACNSESNAHSDLFNQIISDQDGLFRGQELGWELAKVKENESRSPLILIRDDKFGLVYTLELEGGREARIEYYKNERNLANPDELVSIICNVKLNGEVDAGNFYRELELHLTQIHGVADGTFGNRTWQSNREGRGLTDVKLNLHPGKKGLTLNFYRPKEFYGKQ